MMASVCTTAMICGLLAGAIAFACLLGRSTAQDPKMVLLNALMEPGARWHPRDNSR